MWALALGAFSKLWAIPLARKALMALAVAIAVLGAHQVGEWQGGAEARQECKVADLKAELAEMKTQASARNALLSLARENAEVDRAAAEMADEKVSEYEKLLEAGGDIPLTDADVERLRAIR